MVNVINNNGQYKITIPKDIAEANRWGSKTKIRFLEDGNGNIILKADVKGSKIVDNYGQYKITIPIDIIADKKWSSKTKLRFIEDINGNIILKLIK